MNVKTPKFDPQSLAVLAAQAFDAARHSAFAHLAPDLTIPYASADFTDFLLLPVEGALVGQSLTELFWEFVGAEEGLRAVLQGDMAEYVLEQVNRPSPDGTTSYVTFRVLALNANRTQDGLLLLVEDTTAIGQLQRDLVQDRNELRLVERELAQANEKLQHLNRMKSLFLSMAAHDLRTPLAVIAGMAELVMKVKEDIDESKSDQFLQTILNQTDLLNRLINDLLDIDQIEQGKLVIHPEKFWLGMAVDQVMDALSITIQRKKLTAVVDLPEQPLYVWAEPKRIIQILYNLVTNAIKYTRSQGTITVRAEAADDQILLQIIDNGIGMNEEQVAQLFTLYYRTEQARQSKISGTGVGLFIVKTMVEAHRGRVAVSSEPGVGTTVSVWLPTEAG